MIREPFIETWTIPGVASDIRPASPAEVEAARDKCLVGPCPHQIIYDEPGYLYDLRHCYICGAFVGLI